MESQSQSQSQSQSVSKFSNALAFLKKYYYDEEQRLPSAAIFNEKDSSTTVLCAICINDICCGDKYRKLPDCGHYFHAHCIDLWFQSRSTCPLCRVQVPHIIITLNQNDQCQWSVLMSSICLLLQDFVHKMCNPLNDDLSSMLCGNVSRCSM